MEKRHSTKKKPSISKTMWYVAFSLGLLGSLHCVGMCGPLAIAFCNKQDNTNGQNVRAALAYNLGRTTTYTLLGFVFGTIGSILLFTNMQKLASILLGMILVFSFLFRLDIDQSINRNPMMKKISFKIREIVTGMMLKTESYHPFQLGMANGLLPCGLVYLAIAGALSASTTLGGMIFMLFFGLGTLPMLFALTTGLGLIQTDTLRKFRRILPYVSLIFGLFLIYRGAMIDMPIELNFWDAVKDPIMCH